MALNITVSSSDWIDLRTKGFVSGMYLLNSVGAPIEYSTAATPVAGTSVAGSSAVVVDSTYLWVRGFGDCELYTASEWSAANTKTVPMTATLSSGGIGIQLPGKPLTPMAAAIWSAYGGGRQRLLVFGCSIAQQCNAYLANMTSTTTGGDIKAGVNQLPVANGALYTVGDGIGIPLYNARIWTTTITAIAGNVLTIADKLPGLVRNGSAVTRFTTGIVPNLNMGYGAINAAVALLGGPVEVVPSYGYGGAIFTQMYCDLERDLRYYRPHYVALHMYENDMTSPPATGASLDQFKGWARLMAKMCLAYGAIPIVCSSMPYYNCVTGGGVPYSRNADFDGLLDYLCKSVTSDGRSQLQIDVPGSYGMDLSTPWLDPDFLADTTFARRPIYAKLSGGVLSAAEQTLSNWTAITAGSFQITLDGVVRTISGLNFSAATSLTQVASIIKTGIGAYGLCNWDATSGRFILRSPATIGYASATGSGTDISAMVKATSGTAASISQGWTDGVHPLTNKRFAEGYFAKPLLQQILPSAQSLLDYAVTPRETSAMVGTTGAASGLQAGSVVAKNHTGVAWTANVLATFSKNADGSQKIYATWPGAASRSGDYVTDRFSYTFPTVWAGSTQRFKVAARVRINAMAGIAQILPSASILESGTARESHTASTGIDMCDSILADGSVIMLETPVFALGPLATSINITVDIRPKDAVSPSGAMIDADIIEMVLLPVMPETPHSYV